MTLRHGGLMVCAALMLAGCSATPKRDLDRERLAAQWEVAGADSSLAPLAARDVEDLLARWATAPPRRDVDRMLLAEEVEVRIAIFEAEQSRALSERRLNELDGEEKLIRLEAARRDAERAHLETEKLRLQNLAAQEEAERLRARAALVDAERQRIEVEASAARDAAAAANRLADSRAREAELARMEADLVNQEAQALKLQLVGLRSEPRPEGLALVLGDVFFASGQGELKPEAADNLAPVVEFLARYPAQPVRIEGFTDDRGADAANLALSQRRADSVRRALLASGADAARLTARGRGEADPLAANDTPGGRARNRRVEVLVVGAR
jgi:outer membrane protein OmpA-like peptidoglycan-associated protein